MNYKNNKNKIVFNKPDSDSAILWTKVVNNRIGKIKQNQPKTEVNITNKYTGQRFVLKPVGEKAQI